MLTFLSEVKVSVKETPSGQELNKTALYIFGPVYFKSEVSELCRKDCWCLYKHITEHT